MLSKRLPYIAIPCLLVASCLFTIGCGGKSVLTTTMEIPRLDSGPISGRLEDGVWSYKGIPYAAPPVGELRWKEPQPVAAWEEVRACTEYGPACPQPTSSDWSGVMSTAGTDEDCLYLNVWTPAESPQEDLPVMVWIHGGAFNSGAGSQGIYDGHDLAQEGVVVVTINYRLGPLGFLAHPLLSEESPHGVSGNYGLLDQVAALEWVQENIDAFGGDPDTVTVFGQSAGAISILGLMVSPLAEGLFERAIVESGPLLDFGLPITGVPTLEEAEKTGVEISQKLGCDKEEGELAAMREVPAERLVQVASSAGGLFGPVNLLPNVDGYLLPETPWTAFAAGKQRAVPLLTGINANEGNIFLPPATAQQAQFLASYLYGDYADEVMALYPVQTDEGVKAAMDRLVTQMGFAASARFTAECMEEVGAPAYLYLFSQVPPDARAQALGSFHGLEILYVFGTLDKVGAQGLTDADYALSEAMMTYWSDFAKSGDPNGQGVPYWPACTRETNQYQELRNPITTGSGLFQPAYDLVRQIKGV